MKIQIDINEEQFDEAFRENLKWHINNTEENLKKFCRKKKLENFECEDKQYFENLLPALKIVGEYYGVK